MSLKRTPPHRSSSSTHLLAPQMAHCKSDSNIHESPAGAKAFVASNLTTSEPNIVGRKRKISEDISRQEIMEMFSDLQKRQDERFAALMSKVQGGIDSHTEQNKNISDSIEFLSQKYDDMAKKISTLEQDKLSTDKYIQTLENKLEHMERYLKSTSIEVRNVPKKAGEKKDDLINIVRKIGDALSVPIQTYEIRDVYRINNKSENQPIVAELGTVNLRDRVVSSVKTYNRKYTTTKFSTSNLKLEGPTIPVYVSESLTAKAKKLLFHGREFANNNGYRYCWPSRGKIYLRRVDGAPLVKVNSLEDLEVLKAK